MFFFHLILMKISWYSSMTEEKRRLRGSRLLFILPLHWLSRERQENPLLMFISCQALWQPLGLCGLHDSGWNHSLESDMKWYHGEIHPRDEKGWVSLPSWQLIVLSIPVLVEEVRQTPDHQMLSWSHLSHLSIHWQNHQKWQCPSRGSLASWRGRRVWISLPGLWFWLCYWPVCNQRQDD